ncbi:MAG: T9SS type A sorting domain-containing protein, partial [Bacteroidales bacterium]|nr:T9SS type A sorting domain-containing protein [Bacteroidales bacterium]
NIICNNADKIEFGDSLNGPVIGVGIIAYAENTFISNTTFGSDVVLVKTGGSPNECEGGNIFNAKTIIRNLSSYHWRFANNNGDTFNGDVEIHNNGNSFTSIAYNGDNYFNGNIIINSIAGTGIRFGQNNGNSTLAEGKIISAGSDGFIRGNLTLENFIQSGITAQNINVVGDSAGLYIEEGTVFNGPVNFSFPQIYLNGATFNNTVTIEKKGDKGNSSSGGNIFFAYVTITNSSSSYMRLANNLPDNFYSKASFIATGTGEFSPAYNTNCRFYGDISTIGSTKIVTFSSGINGIVTICGDSSQNISGDTAFPPRFRRLSINKSSGNLILASPVSIGANLTFVKGNIISTSSSLLTFNNNAISTGASDSSCVVGPVRKTGNEEFVFPVGKNGCYRPIKISVPSVASHHFTAEYFSGSPDTIYGSELDITLKNISTKEYWLLNRTNGNSNVKVGLSWNENSGVTPGPEAVRVAKWNGSKWLDLGNGGCSGDTTSGELISASTVTSFSPFTLGFTKNDGSLPIQLLDFNAEVIEKKVQISWTTYSEINNDFFIIEKSMDLKNWGIAGKVHGAGNSDKIINYKINDENPLNGNSYYRLKQTDFDGRSAFSEAVRIAFNNEDIGFKIYPNPANNEITIETIPTGEEGILIICNVSGKELIKVKGIRQKEQVDIGDLPSGIYFVKLITDKTVKVMKIIKN